MAGHEVAIGEVRGKPQLLLLVCCGPCLTAVHRILTERYRVTAFFYNPNIHPYEEYLRRLRGAQVYASAVGLPLVPGRYEPERWFAAVAGLESEVEGGRRCRACYHLRLREAAARADENGFAWFATTLTISPYKRAEAVNEEGRRASEGGKPAFLAADFKKRGGFKASCELARQYGLRRQNYCGCVYSLAARQRKMEKTQ